MKAQAVFLRRVLIGLAAATGTCLYLMATWQDGMDHIFAPRRSKRLFDSPWTWGCDNNSCVRRLLRRSETRTSAESCRMLCTLPLWPKPSGPYSLGNSSSSFLASSMRIVVHREVQGETRLLLLRAGEGLRRNLQALVPEFELETPNRHHLLLVVQINVTDADSSRLATDVDETYLLHVKKKDGRVLASVIAVSFAGARHGVETLSQLVWWDEDDATLRVLDNVRVSDGPRFVHRGIMVDSARNFLSLSALRTTIDAMAAVKMNVLHWHLTDTQSFPLYSPKFPEMAKYGAYSAQETYDVEDVLLLSHYARDRGVRLVLEVDAPAHAGEGWTWGESRGMGPLSLCVDRKPWYSYCGQPPCGQLNPFNNNTYLLLRRIYRELLRISPYTDLLHLGGDEVNYNCWQHTRELQSDVRRGWGRTRDLILKTWGNFLEGAVYQLEAASRGKRPKIVLWSSDLVLRNDLTRFLKPQDVVIQSWGASLWNQTGRFLQLGYNVIVSHVDAWYLDCGFGDYRTNGMGPCSPIATWQTVYQHRPWKQLRLQGRSLRGLLGGEACLWGEKVDESSLHQKLWPRAAALAERLWTDPEPGRIAEGEPQDENLKKAYHRISHMRQRLVARGIPADALWPQYCHDNPTMCL